MNKLWLMNALSYCGGIFVDPFQELDFMTPLTRSNLVKIWLLNNLGANCFVFLLVIYQAIGIFSVLDIVNVFREMDLTKTDIGSMGVQIVIMVVAIKPLIWTYSSRSKDIYDVTRRISAKYGSVPSHLRQDLTGRLNRFSLILTGSTFLAVILASIGMYLAVISSSPSLTLPATILYFATFFVSNFVIYLPPIQLSVHWLTCYAIDACIQNLRFWRQNLNVDCGDRDSEKWAQFKNEKVPTSADAGKRVRTFALDEGFAALRDATDLNQAFGSIILIFFGQCLISLVVVCLFLSSVYMLVDPPSQISFYFRICLLVMYLLGGIVNLLRMNSLAQRGQGLLDEAQNCVDYLQMLRVREGVGMEEQDLVKLGVLTEKMAAYQGIRPKDYFTLCQSSKLSGIGLSLTYYIVLLQFRASE